MFRQQRDLFQRFIHEMLIHILIADDRLHDFINDFIISKSVVVSRHADDNKIQGFGQLDHFIGDIRHHNADIVQNQSHFAQVMQILNRFALLLHAVLNGIKRADDQLFGIPLFLNGLNDLRKEIDIRHL